MSPGVIRIATTAAVIVTLCSLVLLAASGFFTSWVGVAASVRPYQVEEPTRLVLVVDDAGEHREVRWPADALLGLELPVDATGLPPRVLPEGAPRTSKSRFSLSFVVVKPDVGPVTVTTTSPRALALSVLLGLVLLAGRNMAASGSPIRFASRPTVLPKALPTAGQPTRSKTRPKKGPPPKKGRRRRR